MEEMKGLEKIEDYKMVVGWNCGRGRELVRGLNLEYRVRVVGDIDERYGERLKGEEIGM